MKTAFKYVAIIFALTLITAPAYSWNRRTHSTIAYIAEQHLTPKAQKAVNEILDGKSIVYYGSWLDDYRKQMTVDYTDDKGNDKTGTISHVFITDEDKNPIHREHCAIYTINQSIEILKDYKNVDDSTRLAAMQCIIHLVGDIHCPAHVRYADRDKNSTDKKYDQTKVKQGEKNVKMHSIWDATLINNTTAGGVYDLAYLADRATKAEIKKIQAGTPYDWGKEVANETHHVWTLNEGDKIKFSYMLEHRELAIDLVEKAGLRLAKVLNDLFK